MIGERGRACVSFSFPFPERKTTTRSNASRYSTNQKKFYFSFTLEERDSPGGIAARIQWMVGKIKLFLNFGRDYLGLRSRELVYSGTAGPG